MSKQIDSSNTTFAQCEIIIRLANSNLTQAQIAHAFKMTTRTVQCILKNYEEHGHVDDLPRSERPHRINDRGLRFLQRSLNDNQHQSLANITRTFNAGLNRPVTLRTVQRALYYDLRMYAHHARKKLFLTDKHKKK